MRGPLCQLFADGVTMDTVTGPASAGSCDLLGVGSLRRLGSLALGFVAIVFGDWRGSLAGAGFDHAALDDTVLLVVLVLVLDHLDAEQRSDVQSVPGCVGDLCRLDGVGQRLPATDVGDHRTELVAFLHTL